MRSAPTLDDLGLRQQAWLFEEFGGPVIDSADLLAAPEAGLRALCGALGVPFSTAMLSWPPGPRASDGVWAPYWYDSARRSTGFTPPGAGSGPRPALDPALESLARQYLPYYEKLRKNKISFAMGERARLTPGAHLCCRSLTSVTAT